MHERAAESKAYKFWWLDSEYAISSGHLQWDWCLIVRQVSWRWSQVFLWVEKHRWNLMSQAQMPMKSFCHPSACVARTMFARYKAKKTVVHIHKPPTGDQVCIICLKDCLHIVSKRTVETNKCQSVSQSSWPFVSFIVVVKPHLSWIRLNASRQVHLQLSLCMQNGYKIHWRKSSQ